MISSRPIFHLLKVTLEAKSAHAIHTGHGDTVHDSLVMRDANGLPALSGSSLAGVLRHEFQRLYGEKDTELLFGYANGNDGQTSWLNVGWGLTHNSKNQVFEGLLTDEQLSDPLFRVLRDEKPIVRQRVRLNDRGSSIDSGKFDITLVPAGARYTFYISYWSDAKQESDDHWCKLVALVTQSHLRVGHGTKDGYGLFEAISAHEAIWDLSTKEGREAYVNRDRSRMGLGNMQAVSAEEQESSNVNISAILDLTAESAWRIGGGERYIHGFESMDSSSRDPDMLPMHEAKINWRSSSNGHVIGEVGEQQYLLPASAIKGAIRHRVAYHYNCLTGRFVDDGSAFEVDESPAVISLFGHSVDGDSSAGIVAFQDVYLESERQQVFMHNKVDRFTGGVMTGALFSENILWQSDIKIKFDITQPEKLNDPMIKQAFNNALQDLADGWLALGASGSRGLGVFLDKSNKGVQWSDNKTWIAAKGAE